MLRPAEGRKRGLELPHFRAVDELAMGEHAGDRLIDGMAEPTALRGDVDEGNGIWTEVLVHGALRGWRAGHQRGRALTGDAPRSLAGGSGRGGFGWIFKALDCDFKTGHALVAGHRGHAAAPHRMEERDQLRAQRLVMANREMAHRIAAVRLEAEALGH